MLATSSKPRLVKLSITAQGDRAFSVAGSRRRATDFTIKVEIGGLAGVLAPFIGKQPHDTHIWISAGPSPTFVRSEGPLDESGPIWRTDLATLHIADHNTIPIAPRRGEGTSVRRNTTTLDIDTGT